MFDLFRIFLCILGVFFCVYSVYLLLDNKIHLGTLLPLVIGGGFVVYYFYHQKLDSILALHPTAKTLWAVFLVGFWLWVLSVMIFFGFIYQNTKTRLHLDDDFKAIIILGSKATNGVPSPALASRLNRAATLAQKNPTAYLITTGGVGFGETISEAQASKNYLISQYAIAPHRIAIENQSTSTELNLKNSQPILSHHHIAPNDKIAIVTSDFHTLRALKIAQKQGYINAVSISAPTPLQTRYHSWLREYFAFISGFVLQEY